MTQEKEKIVEYVFSSECKRLPQEVDLNRVPEQKKEVSEFEENIHIKEYIENNLKCKICEKIIYECTTGIPCLHSFCMDCFMQHLKSSQECPSCGKTFQNFRKNTSLNCVLEAFEESDFRKDRSKEECKEIERKLNSESVFMRFKFLNEEVYEGDWKKCRKEGRGKLIFHNGNIYKGHWKADVIKDEGKLIC